MPSFRVTMTIGALRPGVAPDQVLPTASAAAAAWTTVEASSVDVVARAARITVRFTADGADEAMQIADRVVHEVGRMAEVAASVVTERVKGRWYRRHDF